MKTIKSICAIVLAAMVSVVQAQEVFKVTDIIDGKTILQHAQKFDVDALIQTKTLYNPGISEASFVDALQKSFPPVAESFKHLFTPYFKYVYTLHQRGLTELQVRGETTGVELAALFTDLSTFNTNNPGIIPPTAEYVWRGWRQFKRDIIRLLSGGLLK